MITGSLLLGLLGLYQSITHKSIPWWLYASIAFVFLGWAFFGAWNKQHKRAEDELAKNQSPDIKGEILAVFWERPLANDVPPEEVRKHSRYYVKLRLVNHRDVACTINRYFITVESYDRRTGHSEGRLAGIGRLYHPTSSYTDERTETTETSRTYTWTYPLQIESHLPLERAHKKEGWVVFDVLNYVPHAIEPRDMHPEEFLAPWQECVSVRVIDSLENPHDITDILATVAPARWEHG